MASETNTLVWEAVLTTAGFEAGLRTIGSGIQGILGVVQSVSGGITSTLSAAFNAVLNVVKTIAGTISSLLGAAFNVVMGVVQSFIGVLTGGFGAIGDLIGSVAGLITGLLSGAFNILSSVVTGAFSILQTAAQAAFEILTSITTISFEALALGIMTVVGALGYLAVTGTKAYGNIQDAATDTANRISAVTGKSTEAVKQQYFDMAEAISKKTKYTAEDVGTSMSGLIARAMEKNPNASASQIAETLLPVGKFAEAINVPLAQAVDIANTTMKQFNIPFEETGKTVDTLSKGFLTAQMGTTEYAQSIQTLGQFASAAGIPLDTMLSQVSDLSTKMNPEQITMGLRMAYTKQREFAKDLTEQQSKVADANDKYNTSLDKYNQAISSGKKATAPTPSSVLEQAGNLDFAKTPGEILDDLGFSVDDLKNKYADAGAMYGEVIKREQAMHRSNTDIMGDFDKLIGGGARGGGLAAYNIGLEHLNGNLAKAKNNIDNSKGAVDQYAASWDQNLNTALTQTGKAISGVADQFGNVLGPKLTGALNNSVIPAINTIGDAIKTALTTGNWSGVTNAINSMLETAKSQVTYEKAYNFGKWVMDQIAAGIKAIGGIKWGSLFDTLKTAFVGAMEGIRTSIKQNFGVDIAEIYNSWRNTFVSIADTVINAMETVGEAVIRVSSGIVSTLQWAMSQDYTTVLLEAFREAEKSIIDMFITVGVEIYNAIVTGVGDAIGYIEHLPSNILGGILGKIGVPQGIIDKVTGDWSEQQQPSGYKNIDTGTQIDQNTYDALSAAGKSRFTPMDATGNTPGYSSGFGGGGGSFTPTPSSYTPPSMTNSQGQPNTYASFAAQGPNEQTAINGVAATRSVLSTPGQSSFTSNGINVYTSILDNAIKTAQKNNSVTTDSAIPFGSFGNMSGLLVSLPDVLTAVNAKFDKDNPPYKAKDGGDMATEAANAFWTGYNEKATPTVDAFKSSMEGLKTTLNNITPLWTSKLDESTAATNSNGKSTSELLNEMANFGQSTNKNTAATDTNTAATTAAANAVNDATGASGAGGAAATGYTPGNPFYESTAGMNNAQYVAEINRRIDAANSDSQRGYAMAGSIQNYVGQQKLTLDVDGNIVPLTTTVAAAKSTIESTTAQIQVDANTQPGYNAVDALLAYANSSSASINVGGGGSGAGYSGPVDYSSFGSPSNYQNASSFTMPTYDSGTDYVPFDQIAKLHRGEAVLTAQENRTSSGSTSLTYAPTIVIGSRTDKPEVEKMLRDQLDKHTQDIEKMLTNKARGNR